MDLFLERGVCNTEEEFEKLMEGEEQQIPILESISQINKYLLNRDIPLGYKAEWLDLTAFEKLATCVVEKMIGDRIDVLDHREPSSAFLALYKEESLMELCIELRDHCMTILSEVKEIEKHKIEYNWNENEFMPLVMKHFFIEARRLGVADEKMLISIAKFNSWWQTALQDIYVDSSDKDWDDTPTSYKGIELRSPGHKKLCKRLDELGYMFFFEAPCHLLGDSKKFRRVDLVVVKSDRAVIVEIDGGTHRTIPQQKDDYNRDRLIRKEWSNTLRIEHGEALNETETAIEKIISMLDPTRGLIK